MKTERFLQNIIEQIKEAQLKLGYVKESIRLYFPYQSLQSLLQVECANAEELLERLQQEKEWTDTILGEIHFSLKKDRFEVWIAPEGARYVHEMVADPPFLVSLIQLFQENHKLSIDDICACFARFSEDYVCEKMEPGTDFDYVLYFKNQKPDAWYYCIRMEMGHTIYHRFMKEDYEAL